MNLRDLYEVLMDKHAILISFLIRDSHGNYPKNDEVSTVSCYRKYWSKQYSPSHMPSPLPPSLPPPTSTASLDPFPPTPIYSRQFQLLFQKSHPRRPPARSVEGEGAGADPGEKRTGAEISRDGAEVADLAGGERGDGGSRAKWEEVNVAMAAMSHHRNAKRGARRSGRPSTSSSGVWKRRGRRCWA